MERKLMASQLVEEEEERREPERIGPSDVQILEQVDTVEVIDMMVRGEDVTDAAQKKRQRQQQDARAFYKSKKLIAEGMMDISLLTSNANQLKFILYYNNDKLTFYIALVLIILSLILQVAAGILLIFRRSLKSSGQSRQASLTHEYLVLLIFLTTLINILIAVFTPVESPKDP